MNSGVLLYSYSDTIIWFFNVTRVKPNTGGLGLKSDPKEYVTTVGNDGMRLSSISG